MDSLRKYDPEQPRDDDGKWSSGGTGGRSQAEHDRAAASLKDPAFAKPHYDRLVAAGDAARDAFGTRASGSMERYGEPATSAAMQAMHEEAMRIHAGEPPRPTNEITAEVRERAEAARNKEESGRAAEAARQKAEIDAAVAGPHEERLRSAADDTSTHTAQLSAIEDEKAAIANEDAVRAAGHMSSIPDEKFRAYQAAIPELQGRLDKTADDLDAAQRDALTSLHELRALHDSDMGIGFAGDKESLPDHEDLTTSYANAVEHLKGEDEHSSSRYADLDEQDHLPAEHDLGAREQLLHDLGVETDETTGRAITGNHESGEYQHDPGLTEEENADEREAHEARAAERLPYQHDPDLTSEENEAERQDHEANRAEILAHEAAGDAAARAYNDAVDRRQAAFDAKAREAQAKLEALHAQQVAALREHDQVDKQHDKLATAAQEEIDEAHAAHHEATSDDSVRVPGFTVSPGSREYHQDALDDARHEAEAYGVAFDERGNPQPYHGPSEPYEHDPELSGEENAEAKHEHDEAAREDHDAALEEYQEAAREHGAAMPDTQWHTYERARTAYGTALEAERRRRGADADLYRRFTRGEDTRDALKQAADDTASMVRELARHTGRKPQLGGKGKTKKSAPNYCTDCGRRLR